MTTPPRPTVQATLTDRGFAVHYAQMLLAMGAGMLVLAPLSMLARTDTLEINAILMATCMNAGMATWMAYKHHSIRAILEMAVAMYLSFGVLFAPYWLGVLSAGAVMITGHLLMLPAMAIAMLRRREEYLHT